MASALDRLGEIKATRLKRMYRRPEFELGGPQLSLHGLSLPALNFKKRIAVHGLLRETIVGGNLESNFIGLICVPARDLGKRIFRLIKTDMKFVVYDFSNQIREELDRTLGK